MHRRTQLAQTRLCMSGEMAIPCENRQEPDSFLATSKRAVIGVCGSDCASSTGRTVTRAGKLVPHVVQKSWMNGVVSSSVNGEGQHGRGLLRDTPSRKH